MVIGHVDALADSWVCMKERGGLVSIFHHGSQQFILPPLEFRVYLFRFDEQSSCVFYVGIA